MGNIGGCCSENGESDRDYMYTIAKPIVQKKMEREMSKTSNLSTIVGTDEFEAEFSSPIMSPIRSKEPQVLSPISPEKAMADQQKIQQDLIEVRSLCSVPEEEP